MRGKGYTLPFLDMVLIMVLGITIMYVLNAVVKKQESEAQVKSIARYVISVTWPYEGTERGDDIDTWLRDPEGELCSFKNKDTGRANLDRDDLGHVNDYIYNAGKVERLPDNQELMTIRNIVPGRWTLNVHFYNRYTDLVEVPVKIEMRQIYPSVAIILKKEANLKTKWEEMTIANFTMNERGIITDWDDIQERLIEVK